MASQNEKAAVRSGTPAGMKEALKKATTEMLVLFLLRQKCMYVYEMQQEVDRLTNGALTFNTLYLAVYRLQERGFIESADRRIEEGRARTYLAPTEKGEAYYRELLQEYTAFTGVLSALLARDGTIYREGNTDV